MKLRRSLHPGRAGTHRTRRWHALETDRAQGVLVYPQARLYGTLIYCDDPIFFVVGAPRAIRALRVWRRLTNDLHLIMAIPEKRALGSWARWLGVLLVVSCGIVVIPKDKLLRAAIVVNQALGFDGVEFHVYRSLCGLLEHFRAVNLLGRHVMHGLYHPHGPSGASASGPNTTVMPTELMRKQLTRWLQPDPQPHGGRQCQVRRRPHVAGASLRHTHPRRGYGRLPR